MLKYCNDSTYPLETVWIMGCNANSKRLSKNAGLAGARIMSTFQILQNQKLTPEEEAIELDVPYGFKQTADIRWAMRNDVRRALIYQQSLDSQAVIGLSLMHPIEAVILALFSGQRTARGVSRDVASLFETPQERAESAVKRVLALRREAVEKNPVRDSFYNPADFVVPANQIDLSSWRLYKPIMLIMHVSDDCMRNCLYCNVEKRRRSVISEMPVQRWAELAAECRALGVACVQLSGGDPFFRKDAIAIVSTFLDQGIHPLVATKSLISKQAAQKLFCAGLKRIQVSIDAPFLELADRLTGSTGYYPQAVSSIQNSLEAGITVRTNTVVTALNVRYVPQLVRFLAGLGVDMISLTQFGSSLYVDHNRELFLSTADAEWLKSQMPGLQQEIGPRSVTRFSYHLDASFTDPNERARIFAERSRCTAGRWAMVIHSDGKVTLCDEMPLQPAFVVGDVSRQSIADVWESPLIASLTRPSQGDFAGTVCHGCIEFEVCHSDKGRCFRDAYKAFGKFHAPMPLCPRAPAGTRLN
jgi:radical SAM protein with 4Fe4S-binding SPASM domain